MGTDLLSSAESERQPYVHSRVKPREILLFGLARPSGTFCSNKGYNCGKAHVIHAESSCHLAIYRRNFQSLIKGMVFGPGEEAKIEFWRLEEAWVILCQPGP